MQSQKTTLPKTVTRIWYQIDASTEPLGRIATKIANVLRGKTRTDFTPHIDVGDFVVAINTNNLKFTGRKVEQKKYFHYSGYMGGLKTKTLKNELAKHPEEVLKRAVLSMLDEVKFRKAMMARLKTVGGSNHNFKIDKELK